MPRRNKHNARKVTRVHNGVECRFDSQAEYRYALWLEREREAERVDQWVHHPGRVTLLGPRGKPVATMEPDFVVWYPDGSVQYHEVKGMPTAAWRIKRALFEQQSSDAYVVIDAGHPGDVASGTPPRLFDERGKYRKIAKARREAKRSVRRRK